MFFTKKPKEQAVINLGWGHTPAVRKALLDTLGSTSIVFDNKLLMTMDYPEHEGDHELIHRTQHVIRRQVGKGYQFILLTNGATGALDIALRAYAQNGYKSCITRKPPYYSRYPAQIKAVGMAHVHKMTMGSVVLSDVPSNPLADITVAYEFPAGHFGPTILDAVYLNGVYSYTRPPVHRHDVLVGSYSKLLGINGLRVGWLATNDCVLYAQALELATVEYCGLSTPATVILNKILKELDWDKFEQKGRTNLDGNREEWAKLEKFFEEPVKPIGMFFYSPIEKSVRNLMEKAGIQYMPGSALGTNNEFARFNLGADNLLIKDAVKRVLKADQIK